MEEMGAYYEFLGVKYEKLRVIDGRIGVLNMSKKGRNVERF
jgi:hypothetical protein